MQNSPSNNQQTQQLPSRQIDSKQNQTMGQSSETVVFKRNRPFSYAAFTQIYSQVPRLTVDLVVQTEGGVVLVKRQEQSWHGQWHLPGGTVLYREKITDAVQRIAHEELGVSVKIEKLLGYIEYPSEVIERGFGYSVSLTFQCQVEPTQIDWLRWSEQEIQIFESVPETTVSEQIPTLQAALGK